ncbi:MAG: type II toxin-antitoxin system VapC family toxin [Nocardioidaceae bacterium]
MTFVLDASSALRLVFDDEDAGSRHVVEAWFRRGIDAVVPGLFLEDTTNALVTAVRRGRIDEHAARDHLVRLTRLPIGVATRAPSPATLMDLALRHGLTAYDAAYLELAITLDAPLVTHDTALVRACENEGLPNDAG